MEDQPKETRGTLSQINLLPDFKRYFGESTLNFIQTTDLLNNLNNIESPEA